MKYTSSILFHLLIIPMVYNAFGYQTMYLIPGGSFIMGATTNVGHESFSGELPQHSVYVSSFYMDCSEVPKDLWDDVKNWSGGNGYTDLPIGAAKASTHPVQNVSWFDAVKWCNARSEKGGRTPVYYTDENLSQVYRTGQVTPFANWSANGYRLPTEAEWEKAARRTASHRFPWSDSDTIQHRRANYFSSSSYGYDTSPTRGYHPSYKVGNLPYTSPVGYFGMGMAGNVREWCWDWYQSTYYASSPQTDPRGPSSGSERIFRGGSWADFAYYLRAAARDYASPSYRSDANGFRTVRLAADVSPLMTLLFNETLVCITSDGVPIPNRGTIPADSEIVIEAIPWHEIRSVVSTGNASYSGFPSPNPLVNISAGTFSATNSAELTISVQPFSVTNGINTAMGLLPASRVAAWALTNSLPPASLISSMLDDYLCNLPPGTDPQLWITDLWRDNNTDTTTITVGSAGDTIDFNTINGILVVYASGSLENTFNELVGKFWVTSGIKTASITCNMVSNHFIKAGIKTEFSTSSSPPGGGYPNQIISL